MSDKVLTICIPTFNRPEHLELLLSEICNSEFNQYYEILVVDNGSDPETELVINKFKDKFISSSRLEVNEGLAPGLIACFQNCKTKYLMMMADDDKLLLSSMPQIIETIHKYDCDFLSTTWIGTNNRIIRTPGKLCEISLSEIRASSNHLPGIIFKTSLLPLFLTQLESRLVEGCYFAFFYPQIMILLLSYLEKKSLLACTIISGGYRKEVPEHTKLTDKNGENYGSFNVSLKIHLDMIAFCNKILVSVKDAKLNQELVHFIAFNNFNLFNSTFYTISGMTNLEREYFLVGAILSALKNPLPIFKKIFSSFYSILLVKSRNSKWK